MAFDGLRKGKRLYDLRHMGNRRQPLWMFITLMEGTSSPTSSHLIPARAQLQSDSFGRELKEYTSVERLRNG